MRFAAPDGGVVTAWQPQVRLVHGTAQEPVAFSALGVVFNDHATLQGWQASGTWAGSVLSYPDLLGTAGPWVVTVQSLTKQEAGSARTITGSWVFPITLQPSPAGPR